MPYLNQTLTDMGNGLAAYSSAGYTGLIDMTMDEEQWEALRMFKEANKGLPFHVLSCCPLDGFGTLISHI